MIETASRATKDNNSISGQVPPWKAMEEGRHVKLADLLNKSKYLSETINKHNG